MSRQWTDPNDELRYFGRLDYPFPLANGDIAHLNIPGGSLTARDAERMVAFIEALTEDSESRGPVPRGSVNAGRSD